MKKKILIIVACLVAVAGVICGIYWPESEINNTLSEVENVIVNEIENIDDEETKSDEVVISEEAEEIVRDTIQATQEGEDLSTSEELESSEEEEQTLEEEDLEIDAQVEQENIAWERGQYR